MAADPRSRARDDTPRWGRREPAWRLLGPPLTAAVHVLFEVRTGGLHRVPRRGPALVVANHIGHLDPLVLAMTLLRDAGRRARFLALADLFDDPVIGWWLRRGGAIPVQRGRGLGPVVAAATDALEHGEVVVIYPEGRLPRGETPAARPGAGAIALATDAPTLPVGLWGMQAELPGPRVRRPVAVEVGAPRWAHDWRSDDPRAVSTALLGSIRAELLPRARRRCGFPADYPDVDPERVVEATGSTWRTTKLLARRMLGRR